MHNERSRWHEVTQMMEDRQIILGRHMAYWFLHSPRRALYYMSYYKFAAKMIGRDKRVQTAPTATESRCNLGLFRTSTRAGSRPRAMSTAFVVCRPVSSHRN